MSKKVFLNDGLVDSDKAKISATDSGLLYGAGLFETLRCDNNVVFRIDDHLERLFASAKALSINIIYDKKYITDAVSQTLKANNLINARMRITITGGAVSSDDQHRSTLLIAATKLSTYPDEYYQKGVQAVLSPYRQNPNDPTHGHKTTSCFSRMLALQFAHQKKAAEAIWFTTEGFLAEGCISNIFLVKDNIICTPRVETPVLAGIARKTVIELAEQNSIELAEKDLTIDDLLAADEVFLTNVIMLIMPVHSIEKHAFGAGKVGAVTIKVKKLFDDFLKRHCGK